MKLQPPKNQTAEVLYLLMNKIVLTRKAAMSESYILNLTARISNLRSEGINVKCRNIWRINKFGRKITYGQWSISKKVYDQKLIQEKYNKINK